MGTRSPSWSWPALARTWTLGAGLGIAVGGLAGTGGCQPETASLYNEALATAICDVRRNCPEVMLTSMTGTVSFPDDATCEDAVLMQFQGCGESCKYRRAYGRQCLRRLEALADKCDGRSLAPCRRTYRRCDTAQDNARCNLHNCGARVDAPNREALPWLMLLALGVFVRRRGRRA